MASALRVQPPQSPSKTEHGSVGDDRPFTLRPTQGVGDTGVRGIGALAVRSCAASGALVLVELAAACPDAN